MAANPAQTFVRGHGRLEVQEIEPGVGEYPMHMLTSSELARILREHKRLPAYGLGVADALDQAFVFGSERDVQRGSTGNNAIVAVKDFDHSLRHIRPRQQTGQHLAENPVIMFRKCCLRSFFSRFFQKPDTLPPIPAGDRSILPLPDKAAAHRQYPKAVKTHNAQGKIP